MTDRQRDYVCSILFFLFGIFLFVQSLSIHAMMEKDVGSGFVPKIVAGAIVVFSLWKFIMTAMSKEKEEKKKLDEDMKGGLWTVCLLTGYVISFNTLGFIVSTMIYLFLQILILSDETNRKLPLFGVISVVAPIVVYILFVYVIKLPLPQGIIPI